MTHRQALENLRVLVRIAQEADDVAAVQRMLREIGALIAKALQGRQCEPHS
ncbi:hypothetical protein GCM10007858_16180 [Bradyrhizobium liaoningense]|nr:hypothetical protein GCM10007858_16180 [Bradyrhizobium liaoningense]